jgi:hypothetical protein
MLYFLTRKIISKIVLSEFTIWRTEEPWNNTEENQKAKGKIFSGFYGLAQNTDVSQCNVLFF